MNVEMPLKVESPAPAMTSMGGLEPARLLRVSRGFSCLFWSLPLLSTAHALVLASFLPPRWLLGLQPVCFLPLICGLWLLRASGPLTPRWSIRIGRISLLALTAIYLGPFVVWWTLVPLRLYFAVNTGLHYLVTIALLAALNGLAAECARGLGDAPLKREALAGLGMALLLSICTVGALMVLFQRAGLLAAGVPAVLSQLAQLPGEARALFLLPYAMTAYVMWRAKETGFRLAVQLPS